MASVSEELQERFGAPNEELAPEVLTELQSMLRVHQLPVEELSYKWESYCMKMGADTKLNLKTVRDFKKDLQELLEREVRNKVSKGSEKKHVAATPRAGGGDADAFNMLDSLVSHTPRSGALSAAKRKSNFETPASKASKPNTTTSATGSKTTYTPFVGRTNAGEIIECLNEQIPHPTPTESSLPEARIKLKANTDMAKFGYKTMAMKLSEASEILDDRIDDFMALLQEHHSLDDSEFGNPSRKSESEILTVGRIASDSQDGRLNLASLLLETSRRMGGGMRVPLRVEKLSKYDFFLGKIVALRGRNASGDFFAVTEILDIPFMNHTASTPHDLDNFNARVERDSPGQPLTTLAASGPYTTDENLDFTPLHTLLEKAQEVKADALVLCGPFIDIEHPLIRMGDFDLPSDFPGEPDQATLEDVFRYHISQPLRRLAQGLPTITIILVPSVRDAVAKHASWPQDRLAKKDLALPRQVSVVTNPMTVSFNEIMFGVSSLDVLNEMRVGSISGGKHGEDPLTRMVRNVLQQRHYYPVFPPRERDELDPETGTKSMGPCLDLSYAKLGEFYTTLPDVLMLPSLLTPFAKVIENTIAINPGQLSKKRGPGTYIRLTIQSRRLEDEDRMEEWVSHRVAERCRVDVIRI